jgi:hypothetical protein
MFGSSTAVSNITNWLCSVLEIALFPIILLEENPRKTPTFHFASVNWVHIHYVELLSKLYLPPAFKLVCCSTFSLPWRWKRYIPHKCSLTFNGLCGYISHNIILFMRICVCVFFFFRFFITFEFQEFRELIPLLTSTKAEFHALSLMELESTFDWL